MNNYFVQKIKWSTCTQNKGQICDKEGCEAPKSGSSSAPNNKAYLLLQVDPGIVAHLLYVSDAPSFPNTRFVSLTFPVI